jgi:hypothetical protein
MAIESIYEDKYGVTHLKAYYMINSINYNKIRNQLYAEIYIFHDEISRQQNKEPVDIRIFNLNFEYGTEEFELILNQFLQNTINIFEIIYTKMSQKPEFSLSKKV